MYGTGFRVFEGAVGAYQGFGGCDESDSVISLGF